LSLSFEESVKSARAANVHSEPVVASISSMSVAPVVASMEIADPGIMTLDETYGIAAYSGEDGSWTEDTNYVHFTLPGMSLFDESLSTVSDTKEINLNPKQFNISQEINSQYIPFEMNRFYDGIDLTNTELSFHYTRKSGEHGASTPVNVTFNDEKIRLGWLVDANATLEPGVLKFEIHAYGTIIGSDGVSRGYVWKTRTNDKLNVLESICDCEDVINKVDDSWMQELVTNIAERVAERITEADIGAQINAANEAAATAAAAAEQA